MKRCPLVLLGILACLPGGAQQPPTPVIRTSTDEVLLDVVVRDKKGRTIRNLQAADFQVVDDGAPQKVLSLRLVQSGAADGGSGEGSLAGPGATGKPHEGYDPERQIRLVSLVFERLGIDGRRLSRQAALDFLKADFGPNTYLAVFAIDQKLTPIQVFTQDRNLVRQGVERATSGTSFQYANTLSDLKRGLALNSPGAIDDSARTVSMSQNTPVGPIVTNQIPILMYDIQRTADVIRNMLQFSEQLSAEHEGRSSMYPLLSIIKGQASIPGRKTILFFSDAFMIPASLKEEFRYVIGAANRENVSVYAVDGRGLVTPKQTDAAKEMLDNAFKSNASYQNAGQYDHRNVVTRDQAVSLERSEESIRQDLQNNLAELAEGTAGALIANTNDFRPFLRRTAEDISTHYELSYNPRIREYDGHFRAVTVKVNRPGVTVQARNGYFALPAGEGAVFPYEVPLLNAIRRAPLPSDFEFRTGARYFGQQGGGRQCSLVMEVPMKALTFRENKAARQYRIHLSAVALVRTTQGEVVRKVSRNLPLEGPWDKLEALRSGNFTLTEQLRLVPGRYVVETAIMDREGGRISAHRTAFLVPSPGAGIAMSSLTLVRRVDPQRQADPGNPFSFPAGVITPTLSDSFRAGNGAQLMTYFVLYPATREEKPSVSIEFLRDGTLVGRAGPALPEPDAEGRIQYVASSPLESFAPGEYVLRVSARQGESVVEDSTPFSVVRE